ncbi:MmgE/PrpD family protein [soil metagenome]
MPVGPALCAYIARSQTAATPENFLSLGRLHILDTLASIVACRDLAPAKLARDLALALSGDAWENAVTILGTSATASIGDAAFAGAMAAHGAEINDFIPSAFVQPGPAVVSVALALAERRGLSGEAVLRAVITGYELAGRMPKALGIGNLRRAGIANHGVGPVFGAGAAAASLIGLPEDRIADVLTYCAQQSGGSWQWLLDVEHVEKSFVFAGMGARAGLNAALMVEAGFTGVRDSMDHPEGWMRSKIFTGGDADRAGLVEGLGERTELIHTAYKRYPVGGPTQPAVQGLLELLPHLEASAVEGVRIEMPGRWQAFSDAAMPALKLRYLTAIMLIDRRLDFVAAQSLERMAGDPAVHDLMARVDVVHDPAQEPPPGQPRTESARVIVRLKDGSVRDVYVPYVVGFPSHPMASDAVEAKALELMTPSLGAARAAEVVAAVATIEALPQAGVLAQLIAT